MARTPSTSKAAKSSTKPIAKSSKKSTANSSKTTITKNATKSPKKAIAGPATCPAGKPSLSRTTKSMGTGNRTDDQDTAEQAVDATTETATTTGTQYVTREDVHGVAQQIASSSTSLVSPPAARTRPTCFLDLPPELRNQIYAIALKEPLRQSIDKMKVPPLVQAHEQVRKEAMSMFLGINTFKLVLVIKSTLRDYRLSYCCSDGKLRGLGLGSGHITNLQISIKDTGLFSRDSTWKIALSSSGEVTCSGKYTDGRHESKVASISRRIEQDISRWLEGKTQRRGLGLEEVWSLLSLFKMEWVDSLM